ncbi:MAG: hypothetical protein ACLQHF_06820 [Terracidiphilus sp.]
MPNITVTVDESVYTNARIAAALHKTTVTQLVRGFLEQLSQQAAQSLDSGRCDSIGGFNEVTSTMDLASEMPHLASKRG